MDKELNKLFETIRKLPEHKKRKIIESIRNDIKMVEDLDNFDLTKGSKQLTNIVGKYTKYLLVKSPLGVFAVDKEDCIIGHQLRNFGRYESKVLDLLKKVTNKTTNLLVLGAHIGVHIIPIAKKVNEIFAIEANPDTFKILLLNLQLNHIENCKALNVAISNQSEQIVFLKNRINSGGSKRKPVIFDKMYYYDNPREIKADSARLDDLNQGDTKYSVALMDLEGSEYYALQGMQRTLQDIEILIIEFIPHHIKNVAGVEIEEFSKQFISFNYLIVPSLNLLAHKNHITNILKLMFDGDLCDESLIFSKSDIRHLVF